MDNVIGNIFTMWDNFTVCTLLKISYEMIAKSMQKHVMNIILSHIDKKQFAWKNSNALVQIMFNAGQCL